MEINKTNFEGYGRLFKAIHFYRLEEVTKELTPREKKILSMRFGLQDNITHTFKEVGKEFGVTRERIRQIQAKATEKMCKILAR